VAVDLRLLLAALGINSQLERVGDIAVNIAERAEALAAHNAFLRSTPLSDMAYIARTMVKDSFEAFVSQDPARATRVLESDDVVDRIGKDIFHQLVDQMKLVPALVEPGAHILILSRHIERLADHATNVAEQVIFLVESRRVKHHAFEMPPG
jgi:phosphate transport system protein